MPTDYLLQFFHQALSLFNQIINLHPYIKPPIVVPVSLSLTLPNAPPGKKPIICKPDSSEFWG